MLSWLGNPTFVGRIYQHPTLPPPSKVGNLSSNKSQGQGIRGIRMARTNLSMEPYSNSLPNLTAERPSPPAFSRFQNQLITAQVPA